MQFLPTQQLSAVESRSLMSLYTFLPAVFLSACNQPQQVGKLVSEEVILCMPCTDVAQTCSTQYVDFPHTYICDDDIDLIMIIIEKSNMSLPLESLVQLSISYLILMIHTVISGYLTSHYNKRIIYRKTLNLH